MSVKKQEISSENIKIEIIEINLEPTKKELSVLKSKLNTKGLKDKTIQYKYNIDYKKDIIITSSLP